MPTLTAPHIGVPESVYDELQAAAARPTAEVTYLRLARIIESAVEAGRVPDNALLLAETKIALRLGISLTTVRGAIARLVTRGIAVRQRGVGTFLVAPTSPRPATEIYEELHYLGDRPLSRVVEARSDDTSPAAQEALRHEVDITRVTRTLVDGERTVAILTSWVAVRSELVDADQVAKYGLYAVLARLGARVTHCFQELSLSRSAVGAAAEWDDARAFQIVRTSSSSAGRRVEYAVHQYLAPEFSCSQTIVAD